VRLHQKYKCFLLETIPITELCLKKKETKPNRAYRYIVQEHQDSTASPNYQSIPIDFISV